MDKKIVIPCVYDGVYSFREGLARVQKNGKWFYINREGVAYYEDWATDEKSAIFTLFPCKKWNSS